MTLLRKAGLQVAVSSAVGTAGVSDALHLLYALTSALLILTNDHNDFEELHLVVQASYGQHTGILEIRYANDASRNMKDRDILRAIGNLERAAVLVGNEFHVLNHWR